MDTCRNAETGEIQEWAQGVIDDFASYTEISPSGTGVKIFFYYTAGDLEELRQVMGTSTGKQFKQGGGKHPPGFEIYLCGKYFTVTGKALPGYDAISYVPTDKIRHFIQHVGPQFKNGSKASGPTKPSTSGICVECSPIIAESGSQLERLQHAAVDNPLVRTVLSRLSTNFYGSRSDAAFALAGAMKSMNLEYDDFADALYEHPATMEWAQEKGEANDEREMHRAWDRAKVEPIKAPTIESAIEAFANAPKLVTTDAQNWPEPDMSIAKISRRLPPAFPLDLFGPRWAQYIADAAASVSAPVDYVAMPLLACASALIGNARWPLLASTGWTEPPHLWIGIVGDSGTSKSPGAACIIGRVLPEIERRMYAAFPDRLAAWQAQAEMHEAKLEVWKKAVKDAAKNGGDELPPPAPLPPKPERPRVITNDVTIEKVAALLASAAPKGLLVEHDELAGWLDGMDNYNDAARPFWLKCWNGGSHIVDRVKHDEPIVVPRCAVAVTGGIQPEKLAGMFRGTADGLLARFAFCWPEPIKFKLQNVKPDTKFAIDALDRLRSLEIPPVEFNTRAEPIFVPLDPECGPILEDFVQKMEDAQQSSSGPLRLAYGKARGLALRMSLNIEMLRWCAEPSGYQPTSVSVASFAAACKFVSEYIIPMAERVYGDAVLPDVVRNATTLANWILKNKTVEFHVTTLIRKARIPGFQKANSVHAAAAVLVDAGWLKSPAPGDQNGRAKQIYTVNPTLFDRTLH